MNRKSDFETALKQLLGMTFPKNCSPGAAPGSHPAGMSDGSACHAMGTNIGIWLLSPGTTNPLKSPFAMASVGTVTAGCAEIWRNFSMLANQNVLSRPPCLVICSGPPRVKPQSTS